jgi:hypothetical protein
VLPFHRPSLLWNLGSWAVDRGLTVLGAAAVSYNTVWGQVESSHTLETKVTSCKASFPWPLDIASVSAGCVEASFRTQCAGRLAGEFTVASPPFAVVAPLSTATVVTDFPPCLPFWAV